MAHHLTTTTTDLLSVHTINTSSLHARRPSLHTLPAIRNDRSAPLPLCCITLLDAHTDGPTTSTPGVPRVTCRRFLNSRTHHTSGSPCQPPSSPPPPSSPSPCRLQRFHSSKLHLPNPRPQCLFSSISSLSSPSRFGLASVSPFTACCNTLISPFLPPPPPPPPPSPVGLA
ncbi:hypothetical protein CDEST_14804 [Colletotrichum destructivum]|uniref:Uncharacterized protein n=1 Tax=Colletotrichum destructivum TaxID=34406 RepID=A0AAX4J2Z1_9PEZI|nr:hypothetical protein CDEST_14804 [Colletotrichum destructivum]